MQTFERPCAEQRLVKQILFVGIGCGLALDFATMFAIHRLPAARGAAPFLRQFGERGETGAHVFAALRVMRRSRQQAMRERREPRGVLLMKSLDGRPLRVGFAADFVQRDESVENIERRVLDPLRRDRSRGLLELEHERAAQFFIDRMCVFRRRQKHVTQELEDRALQRRIAPSREREGAQDHARIRLVRGLRGIEVTAIHREARDDFAHRRRERVQREIAIPAMAFRNAIEQRAERVHFARHRRLHYELLTAIRHFAEIQPKPKEARITFGQLRSVVGGHQ